MIDLSFQETVAVIKLDHAVTNALGLGMVQELDAALRKVEADPGIRALVVRSANDKFFSIGLDLPQLFGLSEEEFMAFYRAFNEMCMQLYTFPKPTVAAITGHAVAGGCVLALCCDYRLIAAGRKWMGLNEVKLGVPVPYLAHCVLQDLVGPLKAREVVETGQFYPPEESLAMGLVDGVLPLEEVLPQSVERARHLATIPPHTYVVIKQNRTEGTEQRIGAQWDERQRAFVECWYAPQAREQLQEALRNFQR
jgi:enoyl-CoA hydratase/carnithine racemase